MEPVQPYYSLGQTQQRLRGQHAVFDTHAAHAAAAPFTTSLEGIFLALHDLKVRSVISDQ